MLPDEKDEVLAPIAGAGKRLAESVAGPIFRPSPEEVSALVAMMEDEALARSDAPGGGHVPGHAAAVLGILKVTEAIGPMLAVLARCEPEGDLHGALVEALQSLGPPVLEPALAAHAAAASEEQQGSIAGVLAGIGVRDARVLAILLRALEDDPELAAAGLARYGDPAALPRLGAALDACALDTRGGPFANQDVVELHAAIEALGGELSAEQEFKVRAVMAARDAARAPLCSVPD